MTAKTTLFVVACCLGFPVSGFGQQMDAFTLRAKYGEPVARETFQLRPNIEAVVSYGPGRQVCRIELPPGSYMNVVGQTPPHFVTKQQVDEVIDELVPPSVRGKETMRHIVSTGRISMAFADYEHVSIAEPQDPDHPGRRTAVTITFNRPDCRTQMAAK
jgi:hypothetical protein